MATRAPDPCPCGNPGPIDDCCGRFLDQGQHAPTAEALMRSRYTAHALGREAYLLQTWHPATRPAALNLKDDVATKWIGLEVKRHELQDPIHATVEFVARYKLNGRAQRLHEVSRFICQDGRWFYVDGDIKP
jgi:SEC-C motif-containing protein